ncbi:MAG: hypothetical protein ACI9MF_002833 [Gammaproteobacteria bacterium]|jgi:hypothetical protein
MEIQLNNGFIQPLISHQCVSTGLAYFLNFPFLLDSRQKHAGMTGVYDSNSYTACPCAITPLKTCGNDEGL